jgi:hypothetical protein
LTEIQTFGSILRQDRAGSAKVSLRDEDIPAERIETFHGCKPLTWFSASGGCFKKADIVLCGCTYTPVYKMSEPSFKKVCRMLEYVDLYQVTMQGYEYHTSNYATERDVIFVKPILENVFFWSDSY